MSSPRPALLHFRRRVAALFLGVATASTLLVLVPAASATAAAARPNDPIGAVSSVKAVTGGVVMTGWAVDPNALTVNAVVVPLLDGRSTGVTVPTSLANATVQTKYHTGPTPGFAVTIPVPTGKHTVCLVVRNAGPGNHAALKCVTTPLNITLTSAQRAAHNPVGAITSAAVGSTAMRVRGWTTDPDWITHRMVVVLYVNGRSTATVLTKSYVAPRPQGAGGLSAFDISVPVSQGAHLGCVWAVNVGIGTNNTFLGCKTGDTRGAAGSGAVATPALNTKVATEAKRHIGQRYVWGAVGPKTFDCSGLVQYSYRKFGFTTPRVSQDQFLAARLIPASRAVPGDLVFYHDGVGDVYHVGVYLSPGKTVAAIDESSGVNYQTIWDPSSTTYGSFTHT